MWDGRGRSSCWLFRSEIAHLVAAGSLRFCLINEERVTSVHPHLEIHQRNADFPVTGTEAYLTVFTLCQFCPTNSNWFHFSAYFFYAHEWVCVCSVVLIVPKRISTKFWPTSQLSTRFGLGRSLKLCSLMVHTGNPEVVALYFFYHQLSWKRTSSTAFIIVHEFILGNLKPSRHLCALLCWDVIRFTLQNNKRFIMQVYWDCKPTTLHIAESWPLSVSSL